MVKKNPDNQWGASNEPNDHWGAGDFRGEVRNNQWGSPGPGVHKQPEDATQVFPRQPESADTPQRPADATSSAQARQSTDPQWAPGPSVQQEPAAAADSSAGPAASIPAASAAGSQAAAPAAKKSSKSRVILAVLGVLALVALAAGGWYYTQRGDVNEQPVAADDAAAKKNAEDAKPSAPTTKKSDESSEAPTSTEQAAGQDKGPCDLAVAVPGVANTVSLFCDGQWMLAGVDHTSNMGLFYWTGDEWGTYDTDGDHRSGSEDRCYSYGKLKDANAPGQLLNLLDDKTMLCNEAARMDSDLGNAPRLSQPKQPPSDEGRDSGRYSTIQCDGRYVVIVDSVLIYPGQDPRPFVKASLTANPSAKATTPGACGSLRGSVDGADVYPVYYDYGSDRAGACAAEARGEGNARKLQAAADYSSPC
ncbi:hypothetical protein [Corynebacterium auriscanis]|uniref:hypothetical protein n=1 Tax=Corynebacterium auriscanis TaxID=99807 RepID=UPI00069017E1|nr:hypothetical protein [Corynebacterium auriscanis]WJY71951.1 hypothetical protein CAURIC_01365 [Corynebacterium auriscanis]